MKELTKAYNIDCMEYMATLPDKAFDLAIIDPPYGLNFGTYNRMYKGSMGNTYRTHDYKRSDWDSSIPTVDFFLELKRVSKNQIIWGGGIIFHTYGSRGVVETSKDRPYELAKLSHKGADDEDVDVLVEYGCLTKEEVTNKMIEIQKLK